MSPPTMITFFVNVIYISFPSDLFCGLVIFSFDAERQQTLDRRICDQEGICEMSVDVDASVYREVLTYSAGVL